MIVRKTNDCKWQFFLFFLIFKALGQSGYTNTFFFFFFFFFFGGGGLSFIKQGQDSALTQHNFCIIHLAFCLRILQLCYMYVGV